MALLQVGEYLHHQVSGVVECHPGILRLVERLMDGDSQQGPSQVVVVCVVMFVVQYTRARTQLVRHWRNSLQSTQWRVRWPPSSSHLVGS